MEQPSGFKSKKDIRIYQARHVLNWPAGSGLLAGRPQSSPQAMATARAAAALLLQRGTTASRPGYDRRWAVTAAGAAAGVVGGAAAAAQAQQADPQCGARLTAWLTARGATLGSIRFAPTRAVASADVRAGNTLLTLPAHTVLSAASACASDDLGEALSSLRSRLASGADNMATLDALLLSAMLIELRCTSSNSPQPAGAWREWVATLPGPEAIDTPPCWSDAQLTALQGTPVYGVAAARRAWLDSLSRDLPPVMDQAGLTAAAAAMRSDLKWLRWADALVWSRAVCMPAHEEGEQEEELAMLPGVDMCNHTVDASKVTARWVYTMRYDGGGVSLVAAAGGRGESALSQDLSAGDELLLSYGPRLAEELLHVYGFFPEGAAVGGEGGVAEAGAVGLLSKAAEGDTWDAAVLLVPVGGSDDEEVEVELLSKEMLGSTRFPYDKGWVLIQTALALCSPPPGTGVPVTSPRDADDSGWDVVMLREKVGVSVSEAQLSAALRGFVRVLDAELKVMPHGPIPSDGRAVEARRAVLAGRYISWRRARLLEVRQWCDGMRKGIDAEGPTWWSDSTVTKL